MLFSKRIHFSNGSLWSFICHLGLWRQGERQAYQVDRVFYSFIMVPGNKMYNQRPALSCWWFHCAFWKIFVKETNIFPKFWGDKTKKTWVKPPPIPIYSQGEGTESTFSCGHLAFFRDGYFKVPYPAPHGRLLQSGSKWTCWWCPTALKKHHAFC